MYTHICLYIYLYMYMYIYVCVCVCVLACVRACVYIVKYFISLQYYGCNLYAYSYAAVIWLYSIYIFIDKSGSNR